MSLLRAYKVDKSKDERKQNDYYPTPPLATLELVRHFGPVIPDHLWEPSAGRGWISKTLQENGLKVHSSDLYSYPEPLVNISTGFDYTSVEYVKTVKNMGVKGVVTNPPYRNNIPLKLLEIALENFEFCALYLRLTFMEGITRYQMFKDNPPSVLVFSPRMNCEEDKFLTEKGQFGGMVAYAWFVWSKDLEGGTIQWCNPKQPKTTK